jgi:hypothetical protein
VYYIIFLSQDGCQKKISCASPEIIEISDSEEQDCTGNQIIIYVSSVLGPDVYGTYMLISVADPDLGSSAF